MRGTRCAGRGAAYGQSPELGPKFINEDVSIGCRICAEDFDVWVKAQLGQGWMDWKQIGYDHRFCTVFQFMQTVWLAAAQVYIGQVHDCLRGSAEYRQGFPHPMGRVSSIATRSSLFKAEGKTKPRLGVSPRHSAIW